MRQFSSGIYLWEEMENSAALIERKTPSGIV
jgi:hypothetical protein